MRANLFCHVHLNKMPEESRENLRMNAIMKFNYETPIYDGLGFSPN